MSHAVEQLDFCIYIFFCKCQGIRPLYNEFSSDALKHWVKSPEDFLAVRPIRRRSIQDTLCRRNIPHSSMPKIPNANPQPAPNCGLCILHSLLKQQDHSDLEHISCKLRNRASTELPPIISMAMVVEAAY